MRSCGLDSPAGTRSYGLSSWSRAARTVVVLASATIDTTSRVLDDSVDSCVLAPLVAALAPHKKLVECGGGGTCGPNSLSRVLAHARLHEGSGDDVRRRVSDHATKLVHEEALWVQARHDVWPPVAEVSVRMLVESSFASWARSESMQKHAGGLPYPDGGQLLTADCWLAHMAAPTAWVDQAFLALAADCFAVDIALHVVLGTGVISHVQVMKPRETVDVQARVELAYVEDQHILAILPSVSGASETERDEPEVSRRQPGRMWPRSVAQREYISEVSAGHPAWRLKRVRHY